MKKIFSCLLIIMLAMAAIGTDPGFAAENNKVLRIGFPGGSGRPLSAAPAGYIQAKNLFDEEFKKDGWTIEYNYIKSAGPGVNEALANNALDFGFIGDLPATAGFSGGLKTRALAAKRGGNTYVVVPADSPIRSVRELRGKRVGVSVGTFTHAVLLKVLGDHGLSPKDIRIVNSDGATIETAIATKDLDAAFTGSGLTLRRRGTGRIIYSTVGKPVRYQNTNTLIVREAFVKKHPDIVKRFVKVWVKASYLSSQNKKETLKFNTRTGSALGDLVEDNAGQSIKYLYSPKFDEQLITQYKNSIVLFKKHGLIRRTFDPEKEWFDRSFLNAALKELKLENFWPDYNVNGNPNK